MYGHRTWEGGEVGSVMGGEMGGDGWEASALQISHKPRFEMEGGWVPSARKSSYQQQCEQGVLAIWGLLEQARRRGLSSVPAPFGSGHPSAFRLRPSHQYAILLWRIVTGQWCAPGSIIDP